MYYYIAFQKCKYYIEQNIIDNVIILLYDKNVGRAKKEFFIRRRRAEVLLLRTSAKEQ